jgi:hypothetical protein
MVFTKSRTTKSVTVGGAVDVSDPAARDASAQLSTSVKTKEQRRAALEAAARGGSVRAQQKLDAMDGGEDEPEQRAGSSGSEQSANPEQLSAPASLRSTKSGKFNEQRLEVIEGGGSNGSGAVAAGMAPTSERMRSGSVSEGSLQTITQRLSVDTAVDHEDSMMGAADALCCICLEHPKSVRLSCGHMTTCAICTSKLMPKLCPQCRSPFFFVQPG